ncbi:MAG: hypothetical protein DYG96_08725, partial [Chlorobi bacterium CHB2]|nr:hypothetical protein [Chlorobi bacterium CHB2]
GTGNKIGTTVGTAVESFIGGGSQNHIVANADNSVIGGGDLDTINGDNAFIGGGFRNFSSSTYSVIGGGNSNRATGTGSAILGGQNNRATGTSSVVVGGNTDSATATEAFVGGGLRNTASAAQSVVVGGADNKATAANSGVFGGTNNRVTNTFATIGGGQNNLIDATEAAIGGGSGNHIRFSSGRGVIAGGLNDSINGSFGAIGGGERNFVNGTASAIPGGRYLKVGDNSFGFNGSATNTMVDLSGQDTIAAFNDVDLLIGNTDGHAQVLRFYENNSSFTYTGTNFTGLRSAAITTANTIYTLPDAAPASNGQMLVSTTGGTMSWGNKTTKTTVTKDVASVGAGASSVETFTVTGAGTTGAVSISPQNALADGLIISYARVSAAGTVEVKFRNESGAAIDPASMDWYISVVE